MNRPALNQFKIRDFSSSLGSALKASTQDHDSNQAKSFRLLCLDDLTLQRFDIGSSPPYIAISHTWAERLFDDIPGFDSSLGGRAIRKALSEKFSAVNHCWVDNFCILQDNENDKFEQIPLMGNIYPMQMLLGRLWMASSRLVFPLAVTRAMNWLSCRWLRRSGVTSANTCGAGGRSESIKRSNIEPPPFVPRAQSELRGGAVHSSANSTNTSMCAICRKRPSVTTIVRLRLLDKAPYNYAEMRVRYCGEC